jgi:hypothetical protein
MAERLMPKERGGFERVKVWKHRPREAQEDASVPAPQEIYAEWMKATFGPALS